jgi:hypothetical protein
VARCAAGLRPTSCRLGVIRVTPTGSKASPNVRYAFNSDRILCGATNRRDVPDQTHTVQQKSPLTRSPRQRGRAESEAFRGRGPWRGSEDHQLEFGWHFHRQISRLPAFQNSIHEIDRPAPVLLVGNAVAKGDVSKVPPIANRNYDPALMFAALMTAALAVISAFTRASSSAGFTGIGSTPRVASFSRTLPDCSMLKVSW